MPRKRVVFLMSDTGGGHRAAAEAIRAAMDSLYPGEYAFELVDVYRRYTPFPFNYMPEIYPRWVEWAGRSMGLGFWLANAHRRSCLVMATLIQSWKRGMRRMVAEHPANVIVPVHSLFPRPAMHAFHTSQPYRPPFVTVVTDLVTTHAFWYQKDIERYLVPTQAAYDRGREFGLRPGQLRITGLPVHPRFTGNLPDKATARRELGWDLRLPVVLLTGGADGMGPVYRLARALNARRLDVQLAIIAGRNQALRRRLQAVRWHQPTHIYPFVSNMPDLMAAADVLVTKAGPATISEACVVGLPIVISGAVPGQEYGNVAHVVDNGAGVYAPDAAQVADTITAWLAGRIEEYAQNARALGHPNAAWEIAEEIHIQAQKAPIRTRYAPRRQPCLRPAPEDGWVI